MDQRIISFMKKNTVLTLAVSRANVPHCSACFYAYEETGDFLVFKSKRETAHVQQALENVSVSGTILPDKLDTGKIQGIQFAGTFISPAGALLVSLKKSYYGKYPFAHAFSGEIWAVELSGIKFNDQTLGFGKNMIWEKNTTCAI